MKKFTEICTMTQAEVKEYMNTYLSGKKYEVINEDGFLYAKGDIPVLLVAHMDTVHKEQCKKIIDVNGHKSSPQGIGGDDRCGIFIIMNLVKELHCSVLLCEDEEIGAVGARKFTQTDYIKNLDVNYMIEFDRKGSKDAVFYSCDNKDFIDFVTNATDFEFANGSFSDISVLMPAAKLSAVNLSCGYYNAHTKDEYVVYSEMMHTVEEAKALIGTECTEPFKYIAKSYSNFSWSEYGRRNSDYGSKYKYNSKGYDDGFAYQGSFFDSFSSYVDKDLADLAKNDSGIELQVLYIGFDGNEEAANANGNTKAECWMNLFIDNPDLCFNNITDFTWS